MWAATGVLVVGEMHHHQWCPRGGFSPHSVREGRRAYVTLNAAVEPNASVGKEGTWTCMLKLGTARGNGNSTTSLQSVSLFYLLCFAFSREHAVFTRSLSHSNRVFFLHFPLIILLVILILHRIGAYFKSTVFSSICDSVQKPRGELIFEGTEI